MREAAAALIVIAAIFDGIGAYYHLFTGSSSTEQPEMPARPEDVLKYRRGSLPGTATSGFLGFVLLVQTGMAVGCAVVLFQKKAPVFAAAAGGVQLLIPLISLMFGAGFEWRDLVGIPAGIVVLAAAASYWPDPNAERESDSRSKSANSRRR